ncbi:MAG: hypothetical protein H6631_01060 [Anaerolineaceae bacterium]|nr:hypothetical protein [Anaerolineaceae bacterium]MCB9098111.1 hypothetical protein [Anaerolineales bacterium]
MLPTNQVTHRKNRLSLLLALLLTALIVAACGGAAPAAAPEQSAPAEAARPSPESQSDEAMADESMAEKDTMADKAMADDAMTDEAMADEAMPDKEAMADDAMTDEAMADEAMTDEEAMAGDPASDAMTEHTAMADDAAGDEAMSDEAMTDSAPVDLPAWYNVELTNVNTGETFKIADFQNKVVLVETMAVWCTNCLRQQREVLSLHSQLGDQPGLVSVAIDIDPNEDNAILKAHTDKNGFDWVYAVAPGEVAAEIGQLYGGQFLNPPATPMLIIDRQGQAHPLEFGPKSAQTLQEALAPFLSEEG